MSNRIEEAIRKIIFERKQRDILLESIIKRSLFEDDDLPVKTARRRTTILKKAPKDVRAVAAKYGGIAYRAVIRGKGLTIGEINNLVHGKTSGNSQIGAMSPPYNTGDYTYIVSTTADFSTEDERYSFYIVNVLVLPNSNLDKYKRPKKEQTGSIINFINSSPMITAHSFNDDYQNIPQDIIDALQVKRISKYELKQIFAQVTQAQSAEPATTDADTSATQEDVISDVKDIPLGNGIFNGKYNETKGIPIRGEWTVDSKLMSGDFIYDANTNRWWFSSGTKQIKTPNDEKLFQGTFDQNGFLEGSASLTITDPTNDTVEVYKTFYKDGVIDTTNSKSTFTQYKLKKIVAFYEGSFTENAAFKTGTVYTDDTKSTKIGTYTNGEYKQSETK